MRVYNQAKRFDNPLCRAIQLLRVGAPPRAPTCLASAAFPSVLSECLKSRGRPSFRRRIAQKSLLWNPYKSFLRIEGRIISVFDARRIFFSHPPPASAGLVPAERQLICYRMTALPQLRAFPCDSNRGNHGGNQKTPQLFFSHALIRTYPPCAIVAVRLFFIVGGQQIRTFGGRHPRI